MGIQQQNVDDLNLDLSNYASTFLYTDYGHAYGNRAYQERLLWSLDSTPDFVKEI